MGGGPGNPPAALAVPDEVRDGHSDPQDEEHDEHLDHRGSVGNSAATRKAVNVVRKDADLIDTAALGAGSVRERPFGVAPGAVDRCHRGQTYYG